jgi:hypothetical protein
VPDDANKLRISGASLESLVKHLTLPAAFISALSRHYLPNGRGTRKLYLNGSNKFDFWYLLPVRVQVESNGSATSIGGHDLSQMNPFYKLYLPDVQRDILRSCIGIFCRVDPVSKQSTFVTFDLMHGRWPKVALEPKERITSVLKRHVQTDNRYGQEYNIHLVYLTSAVRWWTNSLNSVNEQLIAYERRLQVELDSEGITPEQVSTELNRALHSIAAHLQRYLSELKYLQAIVKDLSSDYGLVHEDEISSGNRHGYDMATRGYAQVLSQVDAAYEFAAELEKKTQNILALVGYLCSFLLALPGLPFGRLAVQSSSNQQRSSAGGKWTSNASNSQGDARRCQPFTAYGRKLPRARKGDEEGQYCDEDSKHQPHASFPG